MAYSDDDVIGWYTDVTWAIGIIDEAIGSYNGDCNVVRTLLLNLDVVETRLMEVQRKMLRAGLGEWGTDKVHKAIDSAEKDGGFNWTILDREEELI